MTKNLADQIWTKASRVDGVDPDMIRKDCCGAWIIKSEFRNFNSQYGWDFDCIFPVSKGGDTRFLNLRPMQWENIKAKGEDFPVYNTVVTSKGNSNIYTAKQFKINDSLLDKINKEFNL